MFAVNSHNEWSTLKKVVVGTCEGSFFPDEPEQMLQAIMPKKYLSLFLKNKGNSFSNELIAKAEKELHLFIDILEKEGVEVVRPRSKDIFCKKINTPHWETKAGFYAAMPRDYLLVVGNKIIASPMAWRSRYNEELAYQGLLKDLEKEGGTVVLPPKPLLKDSFYTPNWKETDHFSSVITEEDITFDAADFMRFGNDIIGQQSHVTNQSGIQWLRKNIGEEFRLHILNFNDNKPMHIDATIIPLRAGLALVNPERILPQQKKDLEKGLFKGWDLVYAPSPAIYKEDTFYMTSHWINMNLLSLDEKRIMIEQKEEKMYSFLKDLGFDPIKCPFRHFNAFGGSFHCATSDIVRDSKSETLLHTSN